MKNKSEYIEILIKMSLPIFMNYIVMTLFEIIDKAIVGNYSTKGFAAIGVAASFVYLITGAFGVLSVAYNIIAAQFIGKNNKSKFKEAFKTVMIISLVIGIIIIILSMIGGRVLFEVIYGLKGEVLELSLAYFYISSVTVLLNMIIFNFSVYFRNIRNTRISFYSTIASTTVNIVFDYVLVYGKFGFPELGVKGAALGSVLGLLSGIAIFILKYYEKNKIKDKFSVNKEMTIKLIKLYIPLLGQDIIEGTVFSIVLTSIVARLDVIQIASYSLAESMINIMSLPIFALSSSAITLSLQKSFAKDNKNSLKIINTAIYLSIIIVLAIGISILVFNTKIFGLITKDKEVITNVVSLFTFAIIGQVFNAFNVNYRSYLQGINGERFVVKWTTIISIISIGWIFILTKIFKLKGVYLGIIINNIIFTAIYYSKIRKLKVNEG